MSDFKKELIQFARDWDKAMIENDPEKIGRFMSGEWIIVSSDGGITSKEKFLSYIKPGSLLHSTMDFEEINIQIYGNTGIVVSKGTSAGTYKDDPFSYFEWSTNVYVKNNETWQCVLTMLTPVTKPNADQ